MLGAWLDPVQRCCCTPGQRAQLVRAGGGGEGDLCEEIALGEAAAPCAPGAPVSAFELGINRARERAGFRHSPPPGPGERRSVKTFVTAEVEEFRGGPLYEGSILQLTLGESIHEMRLALYANGFSLAPCDPSVPGSPRAVLSAWSPFSLVEKCQVKTMQHSAFWAVLKLTVFRKEGQDRCSYFATTGEDAYKERDRWVMEMVEAIGKVTMSLFPRRAITVQPLPEVAATSTRIMAGYLLQIGMSDSVSLFYCELHAYSHGSARLAVYQDEWCEQEVNSIPLADSSAVSTRKGVYCTVFCIDNHRFCAQTCEEKELWVRAVSNIKVKLMFDAPDPSDEELQIFRASVRERLGELEREAPEVSKDPLLARVPRLTPLSPRGDAWDPDPTEEGSELSVPAAAGDDGCGVEDVDEAGRPRVDALPDHGAYHHPHGAEMDNLTGRLLPQDREVQQVHSLPLELLAMDVSNVEPPVTREMPRVTAASSRGIPSARIRREDTVSASGPHSSPQRLCYAGCLPSTSEPAGTSGEAPAEQAHREPSIPPHIARRTATKPSARPL